MREDWMLPFEDFSCSNRALEIGLTQTVFPTKCLSLVAFGQI